MVPRSSRPADRARRRPRRQPGSGRKKAGPGRSSSPRRVALSPHRACAAREARSVAQRASAPRGAGVRVGWGQSGKYGNAAFWGEPLHCLSMYGSAEGALRKSHACFLFAFVVLFHLEPFFRVFQKGSSPEGAQPPVSDCSACHHVTPRLIASVALGRIGNSTSVIL